MHNKTGFKAEFNSTKILLLKNNSITFACPRKKKEIEGIEEIMKCPDGGIGRRAGLKHQW